MFCRKKILTGVIAVFIAFLFSCVRVSYLDGWTAVNNGLPPSPSVTSLCALDGALYAGTIFGAGVFKSIDGGDSWTNVLTSYYVCFLHGMDGALYTGDCGDGASFGVFKTSNGGDSWSNVGLENKGRIILNSMNGILYAGAVGVFRTMNSGLNWTSVNNGLGNTTAVTALHAMDGVLYAGASYNGVFETIDSGTNWVSIGLNGTTDTVFSLYSVGGALYAGLGNDGVFKTSDGGVTWLDAGLPYQRVEAFCSMNGVLYAGTDNGGVFQTSDGGTSWSNIGLVGEGTVMSLCPVGDTLYAAVFDGSDGGVFKTVILAPKSWWERNWKSVIGWGISSLSFVGTVFGFYIGCIRFKLASRIKKRLVSHQGIEV